MRLEDLGVVLGKPTKAASTQPQGPVPPAPPPPPGPPGPPPPPPYQDEEPVGP